MLLSRDKRTFVAVAGKGKKKKKRRILRKDLFLVLINTELLCERVVPG